jgi:hypothetical protein
MKISAITHFATLLPSARFRFISFQIDLDMHSFSSVYIKFLYIVITVQNTIIPAESGGEYVWSFSRRTSVELFNYSSFFES